MLTEFDWNSLHRGCQHHRLAMLYTIKHGIVAVDGSTPLITVNPNTANCKRLNKPSAKHDYRRF